MAKTVKHNGLGAREWFERESAMGSFARPHISASDGRAAGFHRGSLRRWLAATGSLGRWVARRCMPGTRSAPPAAMAWNTWRRRAHSSLLCGRWRSEEQSKLVESTLESLFDGAERPRVHRRLISRSSRQRDARVRHYTMDELTYWSTSRSRCELHCR